MTNFFSNCKKKNQKKKEKAANTGSIGFTKKVKHRGEEMAIQLLLEAVETLAECEHCEKTFKSQQILAFHVKVMHSISKEDCKTPEP